MINIIGAMNAPLRMMQKRPEESINFRVETKRSRRPFKRDGEDEDERPPQRRRNERGVSA